MSHKIIVVGIGPGDPAYLLPKAQKTIENARILVGGKRALADFSHSGARECAIGADIPGVLAFIRDALAADDVVVMVSGDPGYYSLLDALRRSFPIGQIEVIPGISSLQFAFSRLSSIKSRLSRVSCLYLVMDPPVLVGATGGGPRPPL